MPFSALPERPRLPHDFFSTPLAEVTFEAPGWGHTRAAYRVRGEGPPLLLLHGLMTTSYSFRYVHGALARRFRTYAVDLLGAGGSDHPEGPYTPARLSDWLSALGRALSLRGCPLIGNSMGGYLAMQLALRDPGAHSRVVNLHSPGLPTPRMYALGAALRLPRARALLARLVARDPLRWAHRNVHYVDESLKSLEEAREYAAPLRTAAGLGGFFGHLRDALSVGEMRRFQALLRARRDRGEGFPVPLLLLYAPRDPMVPPAVGRRLHALVPGARFVALSGGSHFAHVDAPELFLREVLPFLTEEAPPEPASA